MNARNVTAAVLAVLFAFAPVARAGRIVVANDDWIFWSPDGFSGQRDGTQFAQNIARWFVGERSGSFLAYSDHRGVTAPELRSAMESADHTWTVSTSVPFDLDTLLTYDAVFVGVVPADNGVLTDYVRAGGNVYVFSAGNLWDPGMWNEFLAVFGLQFGDRFAFNGSVPISSPHPLFAGVDYLLTVNGTYIVDLAPSDPRNQILVEYGGKGIFAVYEEPDDQGPITSNVVANPNPVAVGGWMTLPASVDDTTTGDSAIALAEYRLDTGAWTLMSAQDGTFDEANEDIAVSIAAPTDAGVYNLCVRGTDEIGNVGDSECIMLVAYDPEGGFVTGGGWIDSPVDAYTEDLLVAGKANFGFVSKYKKGAEVPTGNTEFVFHAANLNFHSSSYQWLVVNQAGANAQFKGSGTINGAGNYKFMLWAKDGEPDTFRIKIWEEIVGVEFVYYDNGFDQAIGGGSIVIHTD